MNSECEKAVSAAAGRALTKTELDAIEQRVHGALRKMSVDDHAGYMAMSPSDRLAKAAQVAKDQVAEDMARSHEQTIQEAGRKAALRADLDNAKPGLRGQVHALKNRIVSMEPRVDAIAANFLRRLHGIDEADPGRVMGTLQDNAKQRDIAAALFGETASPEARRAAKSIHEMMDGMAERYKSAGLPLNKREDYRVPQPQDPGKVANAGKAAWVEDHLQMVDRRAYLRPDGRPMSDDELRHFLGESWLSISSDGANKRAEGGSGFGGATVGAKTNAPRQLFFKNSDAYARAMQRYGTTNMYGLINSHVRRMSKEIALAESFGRNADGNVREALARAYVNDQGAVSGPKDIGKLTALQGKTQRLFDAYAHPDRPGHEGWANAMVQLRGLMASSQLGGFVGALPDLAGMKLAAEHSGLPAMRMFRDSLDSMLAGKEKRQFLADLGVWHEGFQHAAYRYGEDTFRTGWGTWLNQLTHKLSGLNAYDRGLRAGLGRTVMNTLGRLTQDHATLASADGEARLLSDNGVSQAHWDVWRKAELDAGPSGRDQLLTPQSIYDIKDPSVTLAQKDAAAEKLLESAYSTMQFGARGASRAPVQDRVGFMLDKAPAGTFAGELWRTMLQFKSVPLGIFRAHWERMQGYDTWGSKAAYGAKFIAYTALMGALTTELRSAIDGQDPRAANISTPEGRKFWLESMVAGGGFGLYGDLFLNGQTAGGSGAEALAGPGLGAAYDLIKEARAAIADASAGESKHPYLLSSVRWIRRNTTPLANLWYAKAAFNRMVYDHMQETLSPGSTAKQEARMEARGATYWWRPGTVVPQHAPDISKISR